MDKSVPFSVPETQPSTADFDCDCPFCAIIAAYPIVSPLSAPGNPALSPQKLDPEAYVVLTTKHAVAFFDIAPLTRGHTLVSPRKHRVKIGHLTPEESAEIGRLLPLLGRAVTQAVLPDIPHDEVDYNIVQNNGPGAAQVVNHVHFHIVPRPPIGYVPPPPQRKYPTQPQPTGMRATAVMFGRGVRHYRDDEDAETLVEEMRRCVKKEWEKTMMMGTGKEGGKSGTGGDDAGGGGSREGGKFGEDRSRGEAVNQGQESWSQLAMRGPGKL